MRRSPRRPRTSSLPNMSGKLIPAPKRGFGSFTASIAKPQVSWFSRKPPKPRKSSKVVGISLKRSMKRSSRDVCPKTQELLNPIWTNQTPLRFLFVLPPPSPATPSPTTAFSNTIVTAHSWSSHSKQVGAIRSAFNSLRWVAQSSETKSTVQKVIPLAASVSTPPSCA